MAPVGFRFHPTEQEIIGYYLTLKLNGHDSIVDAYIGEIDHLYRWDPWDLPEFARIKSDDQEWYFFCRLDYKYSNSKRANRKTENGNWKLTGKVREIKLGGKDEVIGTKKNLVFQHKCPDTKKVVGPSWVIHEFQAKTSPPDERPLVLCKLRKKADDSVANSPNDEGEPSRVMGFDVENNAAQTNIREVNAEQLGSLFDSQGVDFNFPLPLQSQNHVHNFFSDEEDLTEFADSFLIVPDEDGAEDVDAEQRLSLIDSPGVDFNFPCPLQSQNHAQNCFSDEEDLTEFVDSFLIAPDEYGAENAAFFLTNDYSPPRSSSKAYAESSNLFGRQGNSKEYRQMQMAYSDDILLMEGSSRGSTTATRHEHVKLMQPVGEEFPRIHKPPMIHKPLPPPRSPSFLKREEVSHTGVQLQCNKISSSLFNHKDGEGRKKSADIVLRQRESIGIKSEKDRKIVQVTNAKPYAKSRSNELAGNDRKGRFIHFETTISSHRSSPPLVCLLNAVLGLVLFLVMLREALVVH